MKKRPLCFPLANGASIRQIFPLQSTPGNRPPTDTQLVDNVSSFLQIAMLDAVYLLQYPVWFAMRYKLLDFPKRLM
jgi:hypothetical protein